MVATDNPLLTTAFADAMRRAGFRPRKSRQLNWLPPATTPAQNAARKQAADEKRKRKAAKLEAAAARGGIRRAE